MKFLFREIIENAKIASRQLESELESLFRCIEKVIKARYELREITQ